MLAGWDEPLRHFPLVVEEVSQATMEFAAKLRKLMHEQRYSQDMLAKRLDISQNLVSRWARGKSLPDLAAGLHLAELFGVDLHYLADERLDRPASAQVEPRSLELIRELGPAETWRRLAHLPSSTPPAGVHTPEVEN